MVNNFVSKIGDIIVLENDQRCLVLDCIIYKDKYYLSIVAVNLDGKPDLDNILKVKFVEEIIENDDVYYLDVEDDIINMELLNLQKKYL